MGMKSDLKTREKMARVDGDERRKKISQARKYIFKRGVGIDSQGVKEILYSESLVPTHVSHCLVLLLNALLTSTLDC